MDTRYVDDTHTTPEAEAQSRANASQSTLSFCPIPTASGGLRHTTQERIMSTFEAVPPAKSLGSMSTCTRQIITAREIRRLMTVLAALVALGTSIFAIATQPQTALLHREVASLTSAVSSGHRQISALQSSLMHTSLRSTELEAAVGSLRRRVGALQTDDGLLGHRTAAIQRSVGSLHRRVLSLAGRVGSVNTTEGRLRTQSSILLTCVPQLQEELHGLKVQITKARGRPLMASLANPRTISKSCAKTLFGP
jgi:hypothetical protein